MTRTGELETLAATSNRHTLSNLMMEALRSSKTLDLTRTTQHNIPEKGILNIVGV
jgi:hypothetical protein